VGENSKKDAEIPKVRKKTMWCKRGNNNSIHLTYIGKSQAYRIGEGARAEEIISKLEGKKPESTPLEDV